MRLKKILHTTVKEKEAISISEENKTLEADQNLLSEMQTQNPPCSKRAVMDENHKAKNGKAAITGERRTSARLEKDIWLTTKEKNQKMAQKRNLEGTNLNSVNSFFVLADNYIVNLSKDMGVIIDDSSFTAVNLIKDIEIARQSLAEKKITPVVENPIEEVIIEEVEEEMSDFDVAPIQTPKRKGRPKKRLFIWAKNEQKKGKENPCLKKPKGISQGNPESLMAAKNKKGKKRLNERPHMELQGHQEKRCLLFS